MYKWDFLEQIFFNNIDEIPNFIIEYYVVDFYWSYILLEIRINRDHNLNICINSKKN